ncbi:hypothetical protein KF840_18300 [bacterium]|nr:hypothetical protein [bacterium]
MRSIVPLTVLLVLLAAVARAEQDSFLNRDQTSAAETYLQSDGAVVGDQPAASAWDTWTGEAPPSKGFEMPGIWPILQTAPELQTLVAGPTFRNQKNRIELGAGLAYINSRWRFPFELSVEPTWRRNKNADPDNRYFSRVRTFALVDLWGRGSDWESTSFAMTGFYDTQNNSFDTLEFGGSVTQVIGRRLAISGNLLWGGEWANGAKFNNAALGSFGVSYNLGAGARFGGFFEPHNNLYGENDFGGFVSYQGLPFGELAVNVGKHEFVMVRFMVSYALERP